MVNYTGSHLSREGGEAHAYVDGPLHLPFVLGLIVPDSGRPDCQVQRETEPRMIHVPDSRRARPRNYGILGLQGLSTAEASSQQKQKQTPKQPQYNGNGVWKSKSPPVLSTSFQRGRPRGRCNLRSDDPIPNANAILPPLHWTDLASRNCPYWYVSGLRSYE